LAGDCTGDGSIGADASTAMEADTAAGFCSSAVSPDINSSSR